MDCHLELCGLTGLCYMFVPNAFPLSHLPKSYHSFKMTLQHFLKLVWFFTSGNLLLLLSRFSPVRLCVTPWTAAHQASPSMGFSRQEHWSGLPFPSPMCESEVARSCLTLSDSMDCSLPGSSVHGIFWATVLEWGAIAFSLGDGLNPCLLCNVTNLCP